MVSLFGKAIGYCVFPTNLELHRCDTVVVGQHYVCIWATRNKGATQAMIDSKSYTIFSIVSIKVITNNA